jgi:hypothetical protein
MKVELDEVFIFNFITFMMKKTPFLLEFLLEAGKEI